VAIYSSPIIAIPTALNIAAVGTATFAVQAHANAKYRLQQIIT
jgi:hypothetical protein